MFVPCGCLGSLGVQKVCTSLRTAKYFLFFRLSKAGYALSPMGGERIYPSNRCPACPFGPADERVRGSRGSQGDLRGAISIYNINNNNNWLQHPGNGVLGAMLRARLRHAF